MKQTITSEAKKNGGSPEKLEERNSFNFNGNFVVTENHTEYLPLH